MRAFGRNILQRRQKQDNRRGGRLGVQILASSVVDVSWFREGRKVFAHYMVGLTDGHTKKDWTAEILAAQAARIDGFALNIGPSDPYTMTQLRQAFAAATAIWDDQGADFDLFLSFDMAVGEWGTEQVISLINAFKDSAVYCKVDGSPLVSTFEGPQWAENWAQVREATGGIYLVPDWSSLGPHGVKERLDLVDGAFSWSAWPRASEHRITTKEDAHYKKALRGKAYMMGVSPWFYTRLPQWNKNWHSSSERLWYDRWMQVLDLKPDFVQIITWNDYGESSYIYDPVRPSQVVPGADRYVHDANPHAAFRAVLPHFISAYKAGQDKVGPPDEDCAIAWYRTTPAACGHDGGKFESLSLLYPSRRAGANHVVKEI
ncbi:hypothetical protein VPNG_09734 [Cytospora leucostoma]|uniref:GH26 domain-containing protein n=1 Tax=Cytospora leucostoma TaxID=1230097 RepID=A0A423VKM5_9PEZI|nr:hypothetical protein VPNG_09734 [Cytospora leucostoma]